MKILSDTAALQNHTQGLKSAMLLMLPHLNYFKDASKAERNFLKKAIRGNDVGYLTSLFGSLYNEEHLKIWKTFSR